MVQGYWFKYFTSMHKCLKDNLADCLKAGKVPEWMTKRKTVLIQKDPAKGNDPSNYRPITCLPLAWTAIDGHKPAVPSFRQATPTGIEEKVTQCNKTNGEQSMKQTVDTTKTKDTKKTIQNDQSGEQNQEQRSKQTTMKGTEIQSKQTREQNQENGPKQAKTKSRKRITIVGDSMLNGILYEGLQKDHNVQVKRHPGATTRDIVDYVRPVIRKKPDCIIIHAGTNDLTSQEKPDTISNFRKIIEEAKLESPDTSIVLSTAVMRKDKQAIDKKVSVPALNREIREFANAMKISVVDNSNLDVSCLSRKKLHLNEKGNAYLARNFLNFIKTF